MVQDLQLTEPKQTSSKGDEGYIVREVKILIFAIFVCLCLALAHDEY